MVGVYSIIIIIIIIIIFFPAVGFFILYYFLENDIIYICDYYENAKCESAEC